MGTFHNYSDLKTYADKVVKFKQHVSLEAARTSGMISPDHYKIVKDGACAALTMGWLAQELGVGLARGMYHRGDGPAADDLVSEVTAGYLAPHQVSYEANRTNPEIGLIGALANLASECGLAIRKSEYVDNDSFDAIWPPIMERCDIDGMMWYISIGLVDGGRHALGAYVDDGGRLQFFDPNIGAYRIRTGQLPKFLAAYERALYRHFCWRIGNVFAFPVQRNGRL